MEDANKKRNRRSVMVSAESSSGKSMAMSGGRLTGLKSMSRMKIRKMSYGFGRVSGIRGVDRTSQMGIEFKRPPLIYLSTYQLDPHPNLVFDVARVTKMANIMLNSRWNGHVYDAAESPALALRMAGEMMRKVKNMNFNRYRIISVVTIGQKRAQSYNNAIAFLWDHERDSYVDVQRECLTNFVQITIFGIYLD